MRKEDVIAELKRVASVLQTDSISRNTFIKHGRISSNAVEATSGSWNDAIRAAGLTPLPQGGIPRSVDIRLSRLESNQPLPGNRKISDDDALRELIRITTELGRRPTENRVSAMGKYDKGVYKKRWGSVAAAIDAAYDKFGNPLISDDAR